MVAGKVKLPMPFHKSPSPTHHHHPPPPSAPPPTKSPSHSKSSFTRSLGAYFPRSSAQVQPRPPDVTELLRLVEDLRDRESRLKTELLEHKLLKETVAIVPLLENDIVSKDAQIQRHAKRIEELEAENQRLTKELQELRLQSEEEKRESQRKTKALEDEIAELKKTASDHGRNRATEALENNDELSSSQRLQKVLNKSLKKTASDQGSGNQKHHVEVAVVVVEDFKQEVAESEKRCDSDELAESTDSVLTNATRSRAPRVPKPPPRPSSSPHSPSSGSSDSSSSENRNVETEQSQSTQKPLKLGPPPPPPPPPKGSRAVTAKVRRVPEVVEFYHSLMRRESSQSRRDSSSGVVEVPATANTRDMIGEIENRSSHLLAVSVALVSGFSLKLRFCHWPFIASLSSAN